MIIRRVRRVSILGLVDKRLRQNNVVISFDNMDMFQSLVCLSALSADRQTPGRVDKRLRR